MPINCTIAFPRLSDAEMRDIDYRVMGYAFEIHRELGCLCDEIVYQNHLSSRLVTSGGFEVACEVPVQLSFHLFRKTLFLDLVVNRSVIYELKAVAKLTTAHVNHLLNYLFLTEAARGKLINFRPASVESQFVNSTLDLSERRRCNTITTDWNGPSDFRRMVEELVLDWGTGLDQSLYTEATVYALGGEDIVTQQLPMKINGVSPGNQRFHLLDSNSAFRITTFQHPNIDHYETSLRKLLVPSPLNFIHWVNIARHEILLKSIAR